MSHFEGGHKVKLLGTGQGIKRMLGERGFGGLTPSETKLNYFCQRGQIECPKRADR